MHSPQPALLLRKRSLVRRDSGLGGDGASEQSGGEQPPLVIFRNTENRVLSYCVTFPRVGDTGTALQSDFNGHCLTVAAKRGLAATPRYSIIKEQDIVASVNDEKLIHDKPATTKKEELERLDKGKKALRQNKARTVTFYRQESYFQFNPKGKKLTLTLKTIAPIPASGVLGVKLPGVEIKEPSKLELDFLVPQSPELDKAEVAWDAS